MTSRDYWKRRSLKLEQLLHSRADETVQAVGRRYQTAQKAISQQIDKVFTAYAKNGALNAETAQRLLSQKETEQARAELMELYQQATGDAKKALWTRLSAPAYSARISRLQALADSIYAQARLVGMDEESLLQARLMDTYEQAYYHTIFDEQQFIGRSFDFTQLDNRQIQAAIAGEWSGDSWSARIWNNNDAFATAVEDTVTVGLLSGLRYDEMQDMLEDVIGTDDTEGARYRSARLIRTECAHVANQGHLMGYKAAGLEYYRFLATLDQRTDEECGKLDMQRFAIDEAEPGVNFPPMHPNCRCTTMPDDSPEELAKIKRFARDPTTGKGTTVPGNMSYQEWRKQNVGAAASTKTGTKSNGPEYQRRRIGSQGQEIIDKPTYSKLTKDFIRHGGIIISGEAAERHLGRQGAYASYMSGGNFAFIRDDATVSDVLEEMYHAMQDRKNMFSEYQPDEIIARREIDAQKYLLSVREKYKIPVEETEVTRQNLANYEAELEQLLQGKGAQNE